MAVGTNLLVGAAMAVVLLGTAAVLTRSRHWRQYSLSVPVGGYGAGVGVGEEPDIARLAKSRNTWIAAYLFAFAVVAAGSWIYVDGSGATQSAMTIALAAVAGLALTVFVMTGFYHVARIRGYHSAAAAMVASFVLGTILILAIATKLLVASG